MFDLNLTNGSDDYPYLEEFNEGGGRTVLSVRAEALSGAPAETSSHAQLILDGIVE